MKIKKGDNIVVVTGKNKGQTGKVLKVFKENNKAIIENVNIRTKFIKKGNGQPGEQVKFEAPIDLSNIMLVDSKTGKRTRVGFSVEAGKKVRISKVSKEIID